MRARPGASAPPPDDAVRSPTPPPRSRRARRRERWIAVIAVVVAIAVVAVIIVLREQELASPPSGPPGPTVLAALHTSWTLAPGYYESLSFQLRAPATVTGGLFGSEGMAVYLFNATEFGAFNATGATSPHAYASGNVTSVRVYVGLAAGAWYLVVTDPSAITTTTVTVTTSVIATASG